jgi:hypothetical protein
MSTENIEQEEQEEQVRPLTIDGRMDEFKRYIKERGWGPLGSFLFHALMVLLLVGFAKNEFETEVASVEVILETKADKVEDVPEKKEETPVNIEQPPTEVTDQPPTETEAIQTTDTFEMPGDPTVTGGVGGGTAGFGIGSGAAADGVGFEMAFVKSPLVMKGLYASKRAGGKGGIAGAIKKYGGSNAGETAVLKALRWLKEHQEADGSWTGAGSPTAMCGLALLCYMAHGETPASKEFGQTVEKAIRYLMYAQEENGRFKNAGPNYSYGHAIATYALSESYGMTQMVLLKEPMEKAVKIIIDGQQAGGAFDYNYAKNARKDMSVTGWQVQALKAAKMAGCEVVGLQECLYKCVDGIKSFAGPSGGFGYDGAGAKETLNGAGMLGLIFLDHANDPAVTSTFQLTQNILPSWPSGGGGTYNWYYTTQARYQTGGKLWDDWNKAILPMLVKNQMADGHWLANSTHGSCPVYDTTLCCLTLEVYYRYLPTMVRSEEVARKPRNQGEADAKAGALIAL